MAAPGSDPRAPRDNISTVIQTFLKRTQGGEEVVGEGRAALLRQLTVKRSRACDVEDSGNPD